MPQNFLKIIHIGKYHWDSAGGLERYLGQTFERYRRPDYCVDVDYIVYQEGLKNIVEHVEGSIVCKLGTLGKMCSCPVIYTTTPLGKNFNRCYDIIHFHHPNPGMQPVFEYIRRRNPAAKVVLFWHSDIVRQKILKKIYIPFQKRLIKKADKIVVTSPAYLETSSDLKDVRHKCVAIPFGCERRVHSPSMRNGRNILAVGRLVTYKGFEYLIGALADDSMSSYKLKIVGDGPEKKRLRGLIVRYGLTERVELVDYATDQELTGYYNDCDLFVLPSVSRAEAFGLVILEAMAYGKPVVTTSIGTATDYIVRDKYNGRVVKPRSPEDLRMAIREILEDDEKARKMGEASLERIESVFSVKSHFDRLHEIYTSLVK